MKPHFRFITRRKDSPKLIGVMSTNNSSIMTMCKMAEYDDKLFVDMSSTKFEECPKGCTLRPVLPLTCKVYVGEKHIGDINEDGQYTQHVNVSVGYKPWNRVEDCRICISPPGVLIMKLSNDSFYNFHTSTIDFYRAFSFIGYPASLDFFLDDQHLGRYEADYLK